MLALSVSDVSLSFGVDNILKDISFSVNEGDKLGIIGANGAGKTSLFKIITGHNEATSGAVYIGHGLRVGMLEQNPDLSALPKELSSLEYMYSAFPALLALEAEITRTEAALTVSSGKETLTLSARLSELHDKFAREGGHEFRARCRGMLMRLGFDGEIIERKISTLSGGQYTRLALARLLATEPDILMLDEPTNHLDTDSLLWLEEFLAAYKKTVLIISHDRYFLDKTTTKTLAIARQGARLYHGNYSATKMMQIADEAALQKRYNEQQKVIAKIKANIEFQRRCNREHNFVTIRSKEKQLARMEKIEAPKGEERSIRLSFAESEESAGDVLTVKDLSFDYGGTPLISKLSFLIRRYERVMVLGANGCGKSTLMKLLNGRLTAKGGKIEFGYNIKIGYFDQENRGLSSSNTVFGELREAYPDKTDLELRNTLALFLFTGDDVEKLISTLSGGERARLTLAKLILKKVNLLIMDEPTNHLDIGSTEALEDALLAFDGTIIAVSHDRYFINKIATRIIELNPKSDKGHYEIAVDEGDVAFESYLALRERIRTENAESDALTLTESSAKLDYEKSKRERARKQGDERRRKNAEAEIEQLEGELSQLDEELFGPAASDYKRAAEIDARKSEIEERLLELYEIVM